MTLEQPIYISDALLIADRNLLKLTIRSIEKSKAQIWVQDVRGRVRTEKKVTLKGQEEIIQLELPRLSSGRYSCWLQIGDQMHLREFTIEGRSSSEQSWTNSLRNWWKS